ncbi:hypothetical protein TIFTF001_005518 [Ficus carica]|uniref:Uncharacterized protein n=1 Tax=Ficus carica TaxID=3494 RepID=A0AA87ZM55_FICCA|nr:hypothetical protein TIFTF001_005518 [Ficus carica]
MNLRFAPRPTSSISIGLEDDTDVVGGDALGEPTHGDHSEEKFERER